jgi:NTE family protein
MTGKIFSARRNLGLVLGGGGARGLAHIGVLKVFEREGIQIDSITGTSMGALVGAMYAAGISPDTIESEALRRGKTREIFKLIDLNLSTSGLLKGQRIYNQLADDLGIDLTFEELKIPLAVMAVDILTGREVTLKEGKVVDAIRASISVPGVFLPAELGPYKLVDGAVLDNLPVDAARELDSDLVIAIDVMPDFRRNIPGEPPIVLPLSPRGLLGNVRDLWNIELLMISTITELRNRESRPDLVIRPELPNDLDVLIGFDRAREAIDAGIKAGENSLASIHQLLSHQG